ncbi:MAG: amidohydrolase [bacterium]|nr:amidohydrolase [bacterium]
MQHPDIAERARSLQDQIVAWRRDFHRHPELGFQEFRTAGIAAEALRGMGYEVQTGVAKTGIVATIGEGPRTVALRADMDALPVHELNTFEYVSETPGKMHACGHDTHTAMLLGAARIFADMADQLPGEIRLLFQPCEETEDEEGKSGGQRMVEEGALDGVDHVLALHIASEVPSGRIIAEPGYVMAAADSFYATIKGEGCHAAHPDMGVDPTFILAQVINAIHGIRARRIDPIRPALISIGSIHAGNAANVIPDQVKISGTIRSYQDEIREKLWRELDAALALSRGFGGDYELKIVKGTYATYNDPGVTSVIRDVVSAEYGQQTLVYHDPSMGGEDFSFMARKAPGMMFMLGAQRDNVNRPHHSPIFDIDESVFHMGTTILVNGALRLLQG